MDISDFAIVRLGDILLVSDLFPPAIGGSAELFGNVYSRLRNIRTSVLTQRIPAGPRGPAVPFGTIRERRSQRKRWGVLHPEGLVQHALLAAQIRTSSGTGVSGVHCGRVLPEGFAALLARAAGARPYACWVHGEELGYIDSSRELRHLARLVFGRARAVFANSANTASLLIRRGVPSHAIHVVRPGVDTERFRPAVQDGDGLRRRLAGDATFVCLSVGRLQRRKGHDLVLHALAGLRADFKDLRYVIVGDGEERPRLEAMTRQLALESVVRFEGSVAPEELPQYYAASDLLVLPNRVEARDFEGFGIVFLEAAASGVPVIAGRTGGVPEAVLDGETGLLVSGEDATELGSAIATLLKAPDRRAAMGMAARERVLREFTWQRAADEVAALHQRLFG